MSTGAEVRDLVRATRLLTMMIETIVDVDDERPDVAAFIANATRACIRAEGQWDEPWVDRKTLDAAHRLVEG